MASRISVAVAHGCSISWPTMNPGRAEGLGPARALEPLGLSEGPRAGIMRAPWDEEEPMAAVRVVVQFTADSQATADEQVKALAERSKSVQAEAGCLQFEVFHSVNNPEKYALIELWESQQVLDDRARARGGGPPPLAPGLKRTIEHYEHHA